MISRDGPGFGSTQRKYNDAMDDFVDLTFSFPKKTTEFYGIDFAMQD
jgi:hypothetical protein